MTITLDLSPELEARVLAGAASASVPALEAHEAAISGLSDTVSHNATVANQNAEIENMNDGN